MLFSEVKFKDWFGLIKQKPIVLLLFTVITITVTRSLVAAENNRWWPIQVKSYYGEYKYGDKSPGQACQNLKGPRLEEWLPPDKAARPYTIGVAFPHVKDSYWLAVNYGIIEEAKRLGVGIRLLEAGGYDNLHRQIKQLRQLYRSDVDGIILGSISYSGTDNIISEITKKGLPIVEVINDVLAPSITAKSLVSYYEMGYYAGEFLAEYAENAGKDSLRIAFLPGPKPSGWAPETLHGFNDAMHYFPGNTEIIAVEWGDTGIEVQSRLIRKILSEHPKIDYLVGNAVAAAASPAILKETGRSRETKVISTYIIPALYDKIVKGQVIASPSDLTVFQGRMAVDMMVRILNGESPGHDFPFRSGPFIPTITTENIGNYPYEGLFGPRYYKPIFKLDAEE